MKLSLATPWNKNSDCLANNKIKKQSKQTHNQDRDEEGVFASQSVTQKAEQDRAQRSKAKSDRKSGPHQKHFQSRVV